MTLPNEDWFNDPTVTDPEYGLVDHESCVPGVDCVCQENDADE